MNKVWNLILHSTPNGGLIAYFFQNIIQKKKAKCILKQATQGKFLTQYQEAMKLVLRSYVIAYSNHKRKRNVKTKQITKEAKTNNPEILYKSFQEKCGRRKQFSEANFSVR